MEGRGTYEEDSGAPREKEDVDGESITIRSPKKESGKRMTYLYKREEGDWTIKLCMGSTNGSYLSSG